MPARLTLVLLAGLLPAAQAEVPLPVYPDCGIPYAPEHCPSDLGDEWTMLSWIPENAIDSVREAELDLGSGSHSDRSFALNTGRWDVIIAVTDSGIRWNQGDLINKIHLNIGELPPPQDASGQEPGGYDLDGNGLVNIQDYAADPRVDPTAGNDTADSWLDPSDLIYTFSDGEDGDGNGYIDDIAGWDFFASDNDPFNDLDDNYGHHGTGVMKEAAAEGNNGGDIGTCPSCSVLPVRVGDTFITDGTRAGQGIAFAVDSGASVVAMAIGALSHPASTTEAMQYAYDNDVLIVAAAGDENAYHHNMPAMFGDALYVHSIRGNNANEDGAVYSFTNFFNCNNYGPRLDLVAASNACATGAVAVIAGVAGIVKSAALDEGLDLNADQLRQLLVANAQDIWLTPEEVDEARTYPSSEGWDPFYGYGRVNAGNAVQAVVDGAIPPMARFTSPEWFSYVDSARDPAVRVTYEVGSDQGASSYSLVWGQGWEPTTWTDLDSGQADGQLELIYDFLPGRVISVPLLEPHAYEGVQERVERVHKQAVTFKLTVTGADGSVGQARRTLFVYEDPDLLPGFPLRLGSSIEPSPQLMDLDGDGVFELLIATSAGEVFAFQGNGEPLPGWPVSTLPSQRADAAGAAAFTSGAVTPWNEGVLATLAAGDLDGDGSPEVVAGGLEGRVYAWHADGEAVSGFPVRIEGRLPAEFNRDTSYDDGVLGAPTLFDLDDDGDLDIAIGAGDSRLYVFDETGAAIAPYPLEVCHPENCGASGSRILASMAVGDIDNDGDPDIVIGSNETIRGGSYSVTHAYDARSGQELPGWPTQGAGLVAEAAVLPIVGEGHPGSPAVFDVDGDGDLEIIDPFMLGQVGLKDHTGVEVLPVTFAQDGYGELTNTTEPSFVPLANSPAIGDVDGDGVQDWFLGGSGTYALVGMALTTAVDFQHALGGWSGADGTQLPGWPRQVEDLQFLMAPSIADLDGDGAPEVIYASAGYVVHAWNSDGDSPAGWPKFTGHWLLGSPAVGDVDGDGYLDVVATTREGYVFAWRTRGPADGQVQWASLHHDAQNTGNALTVLPVQDGPELVEERRCGCAALPGSRSGGAAALVLLLGLGLARRRG